jgi:N-6 DNA Methylase
VIESLRTRPGHENVRGLVRELCVVGLDIPDREINFEVPVPEVHGRIDALFGSTIFEFKRDLRRERDDAEAGLARYLNDRQRATGRRYLGIATDGAEFAAYELNDGRLTKLDELIPNTDDPRKFLRWLDTAITLRDDLHPDPVTVRAEFGRDSLVFRRSMERLRKLWKDAQTIPEAKLKHELWCQHLEFVYGTLIQPEELFLQHTYLTIVAKTMATKILASEHIAAGDLLSGTPFVQVGLHGAVEADFFDWVLLTPDGFELVDRVAAQVGRFRLAEIEVDVLKAIYESLIDPRQRHYLGEYYTPDWLAEWICERVLKDPLNTRVLDPSCGSGTFLFHAVRRYLDAAAQQNVPLQEALERCTDHIVGVDVHPVAVLFARVTYLLAIGADRLRSRVGSLFIPVYLGDSMQWDVRQFLSEEEIEIAVPSEPPLRFPGSVARDPSLLESVLRSMRDFADQNANQAFFQSWLNANTRLPTVDRDILAESYERMRVLHETGRNHIWTYIVRNLTRPLWLSLREGKPDVLIGNPPWLRYNAMSSNLQEKFRNASKQRGLWVGGNLATHQDLSGYFFARSVERYLKRDGTVAFVMPGASLTRGQYKGFRSGRYADNAGNVAAIVRFDEVWTFDSNVWPLFEVPSCVIIGHKAVTAGNLPRTVSAYQGHLPRRDATPEEAKRHLTRSEVRWPESTGSNEPSAYRALFKQGATIVPRRLSVVTTLQSGRMGSDRNAPLVESRIGAQDKRPWKTLSPLRGQIERRFLKPLLLGETIASFRVLDALTAIIPWDSEQHILLDSGAALAAGYSHLARWLRNSESLWNQHSAGDMTLIQRLDYYRNLSAQFPLKALRVVYTKAGVRAAAAIVRNNRIVIDHKLYWMATDSELEAQFLVAIFNSETARRRVESLQSEGQFGPRDFDKVMFSLPIPRFSESVSLHAELVRAAQEAERIAAVVNIEDCRGFHAVRRLVRETLKDTGISDRIDSLVAELLGPSRRRS